MQCDFAQDRALDASALELEMIDDRLSFKHSYRSYKKLTLNTGTRPTLSSNYVGAYPHTMELPGFNWEFMQ
jgi:hypothetical protein